MTTYLAPPRSVNGKFTDLPEVGLARRLTDQIQTLLTLDGDVDEVTDEVDEPESIDALLEKQGAHPLATRPIVETKRAIGRIAGVLQEAIGFISFDPSQHPRDYRGRFLNTGDDVDLPDGRRGTIESLNPDGSMSIRSDGGIISTQASEVLRVGDLGGLAVSLTDGRTGSAEHTTDTGDVVVRLPDNSTVTTKPVDLTQVQAPVNPDNIQYGVDGRQIVVGAGVRDDAGHVGIANSINGEDVTVDFGGDTRTMRAGLLNPTAGTMDSEFPSPLDERLVNSKPDRSLVDPAKVVPLAEILPDVTYLPYSQTPFLADLHERMGVTDPLTHDVPDYLAARDALFEAQPVTSVPLDTVVVTQRVVNRDRISQIAVDPSTGGNKPGHFVRYNGETYVMNGHHRLGAQIIAGDQNTMGRVLDLDRARADDPTMDPFAATGPDATGLPDGVGRGAVVLTSDGHLAFITDAADAARIRAWDDDTRAWITLSPNAIGSVRVPKSSPDVVAAETLTRSRAKDAGLSRIDKPTPVGVDLPPDSPRPRGALAPVDAVATFEDLGDGAVPRAAFEGLMFDGQAPVALGVHDKDRRRAAHARAIDGIVPGMADVPDDLLAELTGMPLDQTYAVTDIGGVLSMDRMRGSTLPGIIMDVPGDDPRIDAYRRRELVSQYINLWYRGIDVSKVRTLALQTVANDMFGLSGDSKSLSFNAIIDKDVQTAVAHEGPAMRAYLSATYTQTQAYLAEAGVDSIVAYRGSSWRRDSVPDWATQPQTDLTLRPLSSWSVDPNVAVTFAERMETGAVIAVDVPRDRILSIPVTGAGAFGEAELVVLAGPGTGTVLRPAKDAAAAASPLDDAPGSATHHSPAVPLGEDMPSRDDMETPDWDEGFAWHQWADFYLGDLPSTKNEDFKDTSGLSDVKGTKPNLVMEDWRHEAKAAVVADLVKAMELVPDEVMFRGGDGGFFGTHLYPAPTQAGIFRGEPNRIVPAYEGHRYGPLAQPELWEIVPVTDPRVVAFRRAEMVNALVHQWAQTSNDGSSVSHAIQEIAAEHFALTDTADWDMGAAARAGGVDDLRPEIDKIKTERGDAIRAFLQAQYDLTQRRYADAGITEVTVYRGMGWQAKEARPDAGRFGPTKAEIAPDWAQVDGDASVPIRPLSSWSVDRDTADSFGRNSGQGGISQVNVVMGTTVPVERILSTPRSGFGALNEWEVVVIGGQIDVTVRTSVIPLLTDEEADALPAGMFDRTEDFQTAIQMASTKERREALMIRASNRGGWGLLIPQEWRPRDVGLSKDGKTFDGAKDEDSPDQKHARQVLAAAMSIDDIEASGNARVLFDAIAAEYNGIGNTDSATRRAELAYLLDLTGWHLPGLNLPDDWRGK